MEEKNYILNELDELSPLLKEMKSNQGNIGPDKVYFDDLQDHVLSHIKLDNASNNEAKGDLPKDYFDQLPEVVLSKINGQEARQARIMPYKNWLGIAASLVVILIALPFVFKSLTQNDAPLADNSKVNIGVSIAADLSQEDIEYIIHRYGSEEDLEILQAADINKSELNIESIDASDVDVNLTEEDIDYLNSIM